jgi:hypothetical protein
MVRHIPQANQYSQLDFAPTELTRFVWVASYKYSAPTEHFQQPAVPGRLNQVWAP